MRPVAFAQLLLILVISFIFALVVLDKPLPGPLLMVLGVLCPSPLQGSPGSIVGMLGGGTKGQSNGSS